jgi:hypothetical protein
MTPSRGDGAADRGQNPQDVGWPFSPSRSRWNLALMLLPT